jgi:hypothetical protein
MIKDKKVVYAMCVVLFVVLVALVVVERRYPEAGSEMVRNLLHRS